MDRESLLSRFEALEIDAEEFGHLEHVQAGFEMLHKYGFVEACARYASTINTMATNAGAPDKFNVTITFAFLSLIAERINRNNDHQNFGGFLAENPDLESANVLDHWYSEDYLKSDFARKHFALPDKVA